MSDREAKLITNKLVDIAREAHRAATSVAIEHLKAAILANPEKLVALVKALTIKRQAA